MGRYDSSKYRVVPLVEAIKNNEDHFAKFIQTAAGLPHLDFPHDKNAFWYGTHEKSLLPPKTHLEALIDYMAEADHRKVTNPGKKRNALWGFDTAESREEARKEAKQLLDAAYDGHQLPRAWYIFEGCTNPDIYIEGTDYVVICEGKWTEPHITVKTTHLCEDHVFRNQMIRHIQGALNTTDKKVYAFYIVDADCGYTDDLTPEAFRKQLEMETIEPPNKAQILRSFYGYTTWQTIKSVIPSVHFYSKAEIDAM